MYQLGNSANSRSSSVAVVGGQYARREANCHVTSSCVACTYKGQRAGAVVWVEHLHHGMRAQVVEQHKALSLVPGMDTRHAQICLLHELGHAHKGAQSRARAVRP